MENVNRLSWAISKVPKIPSSGKWTQGLSSWRSADYVYRKSGEYYLGLLMVPAVGVSCNLEYSHLLIWPNPGLTTSVNKLINIISKLASRSDSRKVTISTPPDGGQQTEINGFSLIKPKYFMPSPWWIPHAESPCRSSRWYWVPKTISSSWAMVMCCLTATHSSCTWQHSTLQDIYVDRNRIGEIGAAVLRDRKPVRGRCGSGCRDGWLWFQSDLSRSSPARWLSTCAVGDLIRQSQRILFNAIRIALKQKTPASKSVGAIVSILRPFLYESTEREPIIIPMVPPDEDN